MEEVSSSHFSETLKNQLIFNRVGSFLSYKDFFSLMRLSKHFKNLGENYLKMILNQSNFSFELEKNPQIKSFSSFLRYFYYRELLSAQIHTPFDSDIKVIRNNKLGFEGVQEFSIGVKVSGFHLYNKDLILLETEKLFDVSNDKPEILRLKGVKKFSTSAKNVYYLTEKNEIWGLIAEEGAKLASWKILNLKLFFPVMDFAVSYHHLLLISSNSDEVSLKCLENPENEWMKTFIRANKASVNIFIIAFSDLMNTDLYQDPLKFLKMIESEPFKKEIKSFCIGQQNAYFVNESSHLYQVDLQSFNKDSILPISKSPTLFDKQIEKVYSGWFYYFALEHEELKSVEKWDNEKVCKWSEEIGFEDYTKILKYEDIMGSQLATANKTFLFEVLGMTKVDLQNKFLTEIYSNLKTRYKPQILYGWGNNNLGQLGLPPCNLVPLPTKIPLPALSQDDEIEKIECGWKMSCFLTKAHKLYMSEIAEKKPNEKVEQKHEEEKASHGKKAKKEEKKTPIIERKDRWINITSYFERLKDKRTYLIANISAGKESVSVLGGFTGISKHVEEAHKEEFEKKGKFRTAEYIINRIQWDPNLNLKEYRIGYEDRFLGVVEIEFDEFVAKSADIKEHRIKYFKKNGEVVWDKNLKIDKF